MMKRVADFFAQFTMYLRPRILICGLLAFSSGFSVLLIVCTVPIWLKDYGVSKTVIGWFSLAYLPYVLKILWAPLMATVKVPFFGQWLGHLRGWAFSMQLALVGCVSLLAFINPVEHIFLTGLYVGLISFFSASRDTVTDAYRIEILAPSEIALGSAMYLFGYRVGMLTSSAGSLFMADLLPWPVVYGILSASLVVGLVTIWCIPEPESQRQTTLDLEDSPGVPAEPWHVLVRRRLKIATEAPFMEFIKRRGWLLIVLLIPMYKLGDNFVQSMSNLFFLEIGFSKTDIASTVKIFGLIASIIGSLLGGIIVSRIGDVRAMLVNGIIHMLSFGLFVLQSLVGDNIFMLYITIALTHVTGGIVTTAFVSYISNLCHASYRVTQYALFSSLRSLDKCLTFPAGWIADHVSWTLYFMITPLFGLPALFILGYMLLGDSQIKLPMVGAVSTRSRNAKSNA